MDNPHIETSNRLLAIYLQLVRELVKWPTSDADLGQRHATLVRARGAVEARRRSRYASLDWASSRGGQVVVEDEGRTTPTDSVRIESDHARAIGWLADVEKRLRILPFALRGNRAAESITSRYRELTPRLRDRAYVRRLRRCLHELRALLHEWRAAWLAYVEAGGKPQFSSLGGRAATQHDIEQMHTRGIDEIDDLSRIADRLESTGKGALSSQEIAQRDGLPLLNGHRAVAAESKFTAYALNERHPHGAAKARGFREGLGFTPKNFSDLREQILKSLPQSGAQLGSVDDYGVRFFVDTQVTGPTGRTLTVRSAWLYQDGSERPRLISMFPKW
ncbi:MAG: hypothetical protein HMLKMBBP_01682 [Planctomycetes bacterium]|nr:hypothetical protein [Planctomycetota bacterium]